jgi:hypothetical protein
MSAEEMAGANNNQGQKLEFIWHLSSKSVDYCPLSSAALDCG